ncbi:hypothetical protein IMG5_058950 [Ichthyophthirius multifiliis]|uniref:40S ribosomal protein S18 n=1 Tax=Ichthyophthirius multifiliis TaxID=5932 RepID=G0QNI5_ICHMU|nr:hypothetical protein IMG5_058950 [Ichthyophthirius multifiliis]EGR33219.1 hypothetical protein IMG5_058950 [Ichthyophthirius multifiliis]|eukprot:XP_004037205.1 hypothetical protein IMG5_058950 [Ichthyophthirius multifiliis]
MSFIIEKESDFKYIHRILNTNIDGKRRTPIALTGIRGIGRRFAHLICKVLKIDPNSRAGTLTEDQCNKITQVISDPESFGIPLWLLNRINDFKDGKNYQLASNTLDTKIREDLERLKKIKSHRGLRHFWGLKVRGQHTKTTGRHGVTIGVVRKK